MVTACNSPSGAGRKGPKNLPAAATAASSMISNGLKTVARGALHVDRELLAYEVLGILAAFGRSNLDNDVHGVPPVEPPGTAPGSVEPPPASSFTCVAGLWLPAASRVHSDSPAVTAPIVSPARRCSRRLYASCGFAPRPATRGPCRGDSHAARREAWPLSLALYVARLERLGALARECGFVSPSNLCRPLYVASLKASRCLSAHRIDQRRRASRQRPMACRAPLRPDLLEFRREP